MLHVRMVSEFTFSFSFLLWIDLRDDERVSERDERGREIVYVMKRIFLVHLSGVCISIIC